MRDFFDRAAASQGDVRILPQRKVTPEITAWSRELVYSPDDYPMGAVAFRRFGDLLVKARLERHTWSHDKSGKLIRGNFRGVTLYEVAT